MREIKFRGKRLDTGEWIYGSYLHQYFSQKNQGLIDAIAYVDRNQTFRPQVNPETVGQFTGLRDKNGADVYEGDVLHVLEVSNWQTQEYDSAVIFKESGYLVTEPNGTEVGLELFHQSGSSYPLFEIEVVGNIYDNPELLRVEKGAE